MARVVLDPDKPLPRSFPHIGNWLKRQMIPFYVGRLVSKTRQNYLGQLLRIKEKVRHGAQINVLFIVDMPAKWKSQSLYDALKKTGRYVPLIGVSRPQFIEGLTPRQIAEQQQEVISWFARRGLSCVSIYDALHDAFVDLRELKPDIVFYQESWYSVPEHHPSIVSRFALTGYIPYFVANYVDVSIDCCKEIHRYYWRHIVLNETIAEIYQDATADRSMAGEFVGLGHPMLDEFSLVTEENSHDGPSFVIYAPHYTFNHPCNPGPIKHSTFTENGMEILSYAKAHPEFNWVFKPHPNLATRLKRSGLMTPEQVDGYYEQWAKLGKVCLTGDYAVLFRQSRALVTDCGSFLSEYGATGKPIIHLISSRKQQVPPPSIAQAYSTYYQAHNLKEMYECFKLVLEDGQDPKKEERLAALECAGLLGSKAASNIVKYFDATFEK